MGEVVCELGMGRFVEQLLDAREGIGCTRIELLGQCQGGLQRAAGFCNAVDNTESVQAFCADAARRP